ncbi:MAG: TonB-dependent receptor, partial [Gemmatimonadetes bacterium]|nr:TonB-dependent receptor [Gemmatimonadota bacterium]
MRWLPGHRELLLLFLLAVPQAAAAAQADILTGRVTDPDGAPVADAYVEAASLETEIVRWTFTHADGRYLVFFPDGDGRYVLRVAFIGMAEVVLGVERQAAEELLVTDVVLELSPIPIPGIIVSVAAVPGRGGTAQQSRSFGPALLSRLPLADREPETLALLVGGVTGTGVDSVSGHAGFSVGGMDKALNQVKLDGAVANERGGRAPEAGVRYTQVTTSTFDVARGGFAGGQVTQGSTRGANRAAGTLTYSFDDNTLQKASPTTNAYTRHNLGGTYGGPLVANKLFYNLSFQLERNVNRRFALAADDPLAAQRSGVNVDSITRFLSVVGTRYGLPIPETGQYHQLTDDLRLQARIDWNITPSQTLTARFNQNFNQQDSTRINALDLAHHGGEGQGNNRFAGLVFSSKFGERWTNTFNASISRTRTELRPFVEIPEGQVRVTSDFADGTRGTGTLIFGGNRYMQPQAYNRDVQLVEEVSLLLPLGRHLHRLKLGASLQRVRDVTRSTDDLLGFFAFGSLADLAANHAERYERTLSERQAETSRVIIGGYVGDTWRISEPLEITFGVRWDYTGLGEAPGYNPAVEAAFGQRTDLIPGASALSPRVGVNYALNEKGQPAKA